MSAAADCEPHWVSRDLAEVLGTNFTIRDIIHDGHDSAIFRCQDRGIERVEVLQHRPIASMRFASFINDFEI